MPPFDDDDLERTFHDQRPEASDELVARIAARVRPRRSSARPRLSLALALSLALLVSLVALGGVGAASNALHSSTAALKSAAGKSTPKARGSQSHATPAKKQYHSVVLICWAKTVRTYTFQTVTKTKVVTTYEVVTTWKWIWKDGKKTRVKITKKVPKTTLVTYQVKVKVPVVTTKYFLRPVSESSVPAFVSKGSVYPVPAGGCRSVSTPTS